MEILEIVNEFANLGVFINATLFYVFVFGREVKALARLNRIEKFMLRIGLAIPALGGLYNVLVCQYPPTPEVVVNVGYASLFTWASIFHYKTFVRNAKK